MYVDAGPQRIAAAFVSRSAGPVDDLLAPVDHMLIDTRIGTGFGNRGGAVTLLLARGADPAIATTVVPLAALSADGSNPDGRNLPGNREATSGLAVLLGAGASWPDALARALADLDAHRARARALAELRDPRAELSLLRGRLERLL